MDTTNHDRKIRKVVYVSSVEQQLLEILAHDCLLTVSAYLREEIWEQARKNHKCKEYLKSIGCGA